MKFESIQNALELVEYLDNSTDRLKGRKYIFHYTSVNSCVGIFRAKRWALSNAACMNDQLEYKNGSRSVWDHLFFASFMSDADESIGMWSMYSKSWEDGVQIAIPVDSAKEWIKGVTHIHEVDCKTYEPTGRSVLCDDNNKVFLSAVAYSNCDNTGGEPEKTTWGTVKNTTLTSVSHDPYLTGYIKDSAWEYEKEIRIKALIDNMLGYKKVAIDIPDIVLDSMIITASPLLKGNLIDRLNASLARRYTVEKSVFTSKLVLDTDCSTCDFR